MAFRLGWSGGILKNQYRYCDSCLGRPTGGGKGCADVGFVFVVWFGFEPHHMDSGPGNRRLSVPARRVTGDSKCVVSARDGYFGLEVMRVCTGKDQRRIMNSLCDPYSGVASICWRCGVACGTAPTFRCAPARLGRCPCGGAVVGLWLPLGLGF